MKSGIAAIQKSWPVPFLSFAKLSLCFLTTLVFMSNSLAAFDISDAKFNGSQYANVFSSASVSVTVTVTYSGNTSGANGQWGSSQLTINGSTSCENHGDHASPGPDTVTFTVIAPGNAGSYDVTLRPYSNNSCGGVSGSDYVAAAAIVVQPFSCTPPADAPSGVACYCDTFDRSALNPSTIFNSNWVISISDSTGILPSIIDGRLRLTNNTTNNAKAATVPGIFPAAGNYISVEFRHYAYNGDGADGIAVALSDYAIPAVPGAYGGSLGYAQRCGVSGFAGGWLGVGIDEWGNFRNDQECRGDGGSPTGRVLDSIAVRGSGSAQSGYLLHGQSGTLSPGVDTTGVTPGPGYRYRIVIDHSNDVNAWARVDRDTGSGYVNIIPQYDAKAQTGQMAVPTNWQISFTGSTGGSNNIHEIDELRVCATTIWPPTGGVASGFQAIDEAYGNASGTPKPAIQNWLTGHIFTKLAGTPFKLNVAALNNNQIMGNYVVSGSKWLQVKLVDNTDNSCVLDSSQANYCNATCLGKAAVASQILTFASGDGGQKRSNDFTVPAAWRKLAVVMRECTSVACTSFTPTPAACATDQFSIRPTAVSISGSSATQTNTSGAPTFKAGADKFTIDALVDKGGYNGTLKIGNPQPVSPASVAGDFGMPLPVFPDATAGASTSSTTGEFAYSEVGVFRLPGAVDATSSRGIWDDSWTAIDSPTTQGDCVIGSYSNTKDSNGKYGCLFGLTAPVNLGRYIPHHFGVSGSLVTRSDLQAVENQTTPFTYMGEPMKLNLTVTAYNAQEVPTQNYAGALAKLDAATLGTGANWFTTGCTGSVQCMGIGAADGVKGHSNRLAVHTGVAVPTSAWNAGVGSFVMHLSFNRLATPDGPWGSLNLAALPRDADGVTVPGMATSDIHKVDFDATTNNTLASDPDGVVERRFIATTQVRFGQFRLTGAYGSELLPLRVAGRAEYWNGSHWTLNLDDAITSFPSGSMTAANGIATSTCFLLSPPPSGPSNANCLAASPATTLSGGNATWIVFDRTPAQAGFADLSLDLAAMPWLQGRWSGSAIGYTENPVARVRFGASRAPYIYLRERY